MYSDLEWNESKSIHGFQAIIYSSIQIIRLDEFNIQRNETRIGTYRKQMRNNGIYMCLYESIQYRVQKGIVNNKLGHIRNTCRTTECMCLYETLRYKHELYIIGFKNANNFKHKSIQEFKAII